MASGSEVSGYLETTLSKTDLSNREFVRENCWVLNFSGKPDAFVPVDQAQEHNIKDIKVTYRSDGPNIKWDYLKKLHPAIPVIRTLADHMEKEFGTVAWGKRHTIPKKDSDVLELMEFFESSGYHTYKKNRKIKSDRDRASDYIERGGVKLSRGPILAVWNQNRCFVRSTEEDWSEMGSNVSDGDPSATDAAVDMSQSHTPVGTVSDDAPSVAMDKVDSAQEHTMMVPHGLDADCTVSVEPPIVQHTTEQ